MSDLPQLEKLKKYYLLVNKYEKEPCKYIPREDVGVLRAMCMLYKKITGQNMGCSLCGKTQQIKMVRRLLEGRKVL